MDDLLKWRGEFPILERSTYLISNSLGAMPRGVYDAMRAYADSWAERGVRAWEEGWWEMAVGVGDKIAPLHRRESGRNLTASKCHCDSSDHRILFRFSRPP